MIPVSATDLTQAWPRPAHPRPIVIIGAGGIVRAAHLPTYRALGFPVAGLFDVRADAARSTADAFAIDTVFPTLADAAASRDARLRSRGPRRSDSRRSSRSFRAAPAVLIQKPMGPDLATARAIHACCRDRRSDRRGQLPAALQPERARAAGSADARRARRDRRHRGPHRRSTSRGICGRF